jgi:hypothetical protein
MTESVTSKIRRHIETLPLGEPFTPSSLLRYGERAAVDQALSRLTRAKVIARVARGIYVRPKPSRLFGTALPEPRQVAEAVAALDGAILQVHGAEAARQLGLTTQMPTQEVYYTSGSTRRRLFGRLSLVLQHAGPKRLALAGRPAGLAVAALQYLGREAVTPEVVEQVARKLPLGEFEALREAAPSLPAWLGTALRRYTPAADHG